MARDGLITPEHWERARRIYRLKRIRRRALTFSALTIAMSPLLGIILFTCSLFIRFPPAWIAGGSF